MNKSILAFAVILATSLTACEPARPITTSMDGYAVDVGSSYSGGKIMSQKFSMLELGRALSKGAVDIYDPWLPTLTVPAPEFSVSDPLATFPVHPRLYVRNKNVRVYSLDSNAMVKNDISFYNVLNSIEQKDINEMPEPQPLYENAQ